MRELSYERLLRLWTERQGGSWEVLGYPRGEGETRAFRITPAGEPRGVVVVAHGAGNDALFSFSALFRRLLAHDFEIFTFDLDGHGRSSSTYFSVETIAEALPEAIERSGAAARDLPLHLLGVSFGGALVLDAASRVPAVTATLIATPLRIAPSWRSILRELGPRALHTLWRGRPDYGLTGLIPAFGQFRRERYPLRLRAPRGSRLGYLEVLNEALEILRPEQAASAVRTPTLLIYGERDLTAPPAHGERLSRALPSSRLCVLAGDTHLSTPLAEEAMVSTLEWIELHSGSRSRPVPLTRMEPGR